jgi:hypothetical protein
MMPNREIRETREKGHRFAENKKGKSYDATNIPNEQQRSKYWSRGAIGCARRLLGARGHDILDGLWLEGYACSRETGQIR